MNIRFKTLILLFTLLSTSNALLACHKAGCGHDHSGSIANAGTISQNNALSTNNALSINNTLSTLTNAFISATAFKLVEIGCNKISGSDSQPGLVTDPAILTHQKDLIAKKQLEHDALVDGPDKTEKAKELKKLNDIYTTAAFGLKGTSGHQHGPGCKHQH
jgi:hypothetical protein